MADTKRCDHCKKVELERGAGHWLHVELVDTSIAELGDSFALGRDFCDIDCLVAFCIAERERRASKRAMRPFRGMGRP